MSKMLAIKYGNDSSQKSSSGNSAAASVMVGNMNSDKAVILGQEFDLLFGYKPPPSHSRSNTSSRSTQSRIDDAEMDDLLLQAGTSNDSSHGSNMDIGEL